MISPSNAQRRVLRRAISAAPDWPAYRAANGVGDTSTLSGRRCVEICDALGLDVAALLFGGGASDPVQPAAAPAASDPVQPVASDPVQPAAAPVAPGPVQPAAAPVASDPVQPAAAPVAPAGLFNGGARRVAADPVIPATKEPAAMPAQSDLAAALATIAAAIENPPAPAVDPAALDAIRADLDALRETVAGIAAPAPVLIPVDPSGAALGNPLPSTRHPQAETLLRAVTARDVNGARLNVWLYGPTGSGKTYAASQVADALGLEFGAHGAMIMAAELLGFIDAGGAYHSTAFVDRFRAGGVVLLDEIDAYDAEALLALNAALANGFLFLPTGERVARHPDFVCIGAGNTCGQGATADYGARAKIDAATLSRFPVKIHWDYDETLESAICGNPDFAARVQSARRHARDAGLKVVIDPRQSIAGAALIAAGMSSDDAAALTFLAGLTPDQIKLVEPPYKRGANAKAA